MTRFEGTCAEVEVEGAKWMADHVKICPARTGWPELKLPSGKKVIVGGGFDDDSYGSGNRLNRKITCRSCAAYWVGVGIDPSR